MNDLTHLQPNLVVAFTFEVERDGRTRPVASIFIEGTAFPAVTDLAAPGRAGWAVSVFRVVTEDGDVLLARPLGLPAYAAAAQIGAHLRAWVAERAGPAASAEPLDLAQLLEDVLIKGCHQRERRWLLLRCPPDAVILSTLEAAGQQPGGEDAARAATMLLSFYRQNGDSLSDYWRVQSWEWAATQGLLSHPLIDIQVASHGDCR